MRELRLTPNLSDTEAAAAFDRFGVFANKVLDLIGMHTYRAGHDSLHNPPIYDPGPIAGDVYVTRHHRLGASTILLG